MSTTDAMVPSEVKTYPATWRGELVLVCRKCEKRLKSRDAKRFGRIRKWFKRRAKHEGGEKLAKVVEITCLGVCPKNGVTVVRQGDVASGEGRFRIIRSAGELESLYSDMVQWKGNRRVS